jgi:hypothetical protein
VIRALPQESVWVGQHENLFVLGPTGVGESFVACALAQKACRDGYSAFDAGAQMPDQDAWRFDAEESWEAEQITPGKPWEWDRYTLCRSLGCTRTSMVLFAMCRSELFLLHQVVRRSDIRILGRGCPEDERLPRPSVPRCSREHAPQFPPSRPQRRANVSHPGEPKPWLRLRPEPSSDAAGHRNFWAARRVPAAAGIGRVRITNLVPGENLMFRE